jgi:hypothetical protein
MREREQEEWLLNATNRSVNSATAYYNVCDGTLYDRCARVKLYAAREHIYNEAERCMQSHLYTSAAIAAKIATLSTL